MIKAVFFDFDGVLTIDKDDILTTCRYVSNKLGLDLEETIEAYKKNIDVWEIYYGRRSEEDAWENFYNNLKSTGKISIAYDKFRGLRVESFRSTELDEVMMKLATDLKSKGYLVGIITDNCKERIEEIDKKYSIYSEFDLVVVSAEEMTTKHEKKIFDIALAEMCAKPEETVFIDNNPNNLLHPNAMRFAAAIHFDENKRDYDSLYQKLRDVGVRL